MTFISYAQNYEDVILYRALKDVNPGFYIDVGAQDPIIDSVTKAFYDRGWRGINIEPVDHWFSKLVIDRPADQNLKLAAAAEAGTLKLYEVMDTGMSTCDPTFAAKHSLAGFNIRECTVLARRLDEICGELNIAQVHFLKIDVEGGERAVLAGIDLTRIRPWIILVESTEPNSTVPTYEQWEHLLINCNYEFMYFDGLNRYYVSNEQKEQLRAAFSVPPNYFDHFIRYSELVAREQAKKMEVEVSDTRKLVQALEIKLSQSINENNTLQEQIISGQRLLARFENELLEGRAQIQSIERELNKLREIAEQSQKTVEMRDAELRGVYGSLSWRMTMPLRKASLLARCSIRMIRNGS